MFVPFLTPKPKLSKRRGGGKSGGGGAKGGSEGGGATGGTTKSSPVSTSGTSKSATSYGSGGGKVISIPSGQPFAGRTEGSGTRGQVFGTQTFGSGYPGIPGRGVVGRGFPFFFWPLSFGAGGGIATGAYLHSNSEYGHADNSSRPGGVMMSAAFQSNGTNGTTFRILADNTTVTDLISDIAANCSASLTSASTTTSPSPYNDTATLPPQPEQVVQYYRASSIALSLDGYNNTSVFAAEGTPDVPLPSGIDTTLLDCLNQTIGLAAPLIDGAGSRWAAAPDNMGLLGLVWLVWIFSKVM
ncbi:hypothetical protein B0H17DRAFT_947604 [Mycena rosella]|uniref:Uncharacterized protein n=1 Tax=Mycena rosella TaxID=1033263 RepID=A0AAD7D0B5_MYCRO|nr:hypothetical protein B0H17DRAFT_947604 [Mycena rosella]